MSGDPRPTAGRLGARGRLAHVVGGAAIIALAVGGWLAHPLFDDIAAGLRGPEWARTLLPDRAGPDAPSVRTSLAALLLLIGLIGVASVLIGLVGGSGRSPADRAHTTARRTRSERSPTLQRVGLAGVTVVLLVSLVVLGDRVGRESSTTAPTPPPAGPGPAFGVEPGTGAAAIDGTGTLALTDPVISELSSSNPGDIFDADGDAPDWIELHNPTDALVDLASWSLSDDPDRPDRWSFPDVTLDADERLVVFASGKDRRDPTSELHTDFRLDRAGEVVVLTDPDGRVVDLATPGAVPRGASWGRHPDDPTRTCWFAFPAPGRPNSPGCFDDDRLGAPTFSAASGTYPEPFDLVITADPPDATIYVTLDGSWPDPVTNPDRTITVDGPLRISDRTDEPARLALIDTTKPDDALDVDWIPTWTEPITPIDTAIVVRARTDHGIDTTATYFVGDDSFPGGLPVVSLTLDEDFLFDHDTGIYIAGRTFEDWLASEQFEPDPLWWFPPANYTDRGRDSQRPVLGDHHRAGVVEICEPDDGCGPQVRVGVRIHGQISRLFPQKGLRLYADDDPWAPSFDRPFLADHGPAGHRRILLRAAGNDQRMLVTDGFLQSLMGDLRAETQAYRPVAVYLNGEYWGLHGLRERYDQHYLATVHGADPDRVVILDQVFGRHGVQRGSTADLDAFTALQVAIASTDPTTPEGLAQLEALVETSIDVDDFFDFVIAHAYAANVDWPANNVRVWRQNPDPAALGDEVDDGPLDGRWRWMIFDLDAAGGDAPGVFDPDYDVFVERMAPTDDPMVESGYPAMFHQMMQHPEWRSRFLVRVAGLLATDLSVARAVAELDALEALLAPEIARHVDRWRTHESIDDWRFSVESMRTFLRERPDRFRGHLETLLGLGPAVTVSFGTTGGGTLQIDGVGGPVDGLAGQYWPGVPLTVRALADDGHRFVGWEGAGLSVDADEVTVDPVDGLELIAVFAPA